MLNDLKEKFESKTYMIISSIFMFLSLILLILRMLGVINLNEFLDPGIVVIIISGYPIIFEAISELKEKNISSELLVTIGIIASLILKEVFAAAEICFIMALGETLEDMTVDKAKKGLDKLVSLIPVNANVLVNGKLINKNIDDINIEDIIRIVPGERIPMDGIIVSGYTSVDQSILTGESIPIDKNIGDIVYQGTYNTSGSIDFKVTNKSTDTTLSKMIKLISQDDSMDAPIKRTADKWAKILVPASLIISILTGILSYFIFKNDLIDSLTRSVTIIVTFCPCALTLSTPTSVMAGIGQATKYGVLIKSGAAIEEMGRTNAICFDKTGTLTEAKIVVNECLAYKGYKKDEVIKIMSSLESKSEHPISKAIVSYNKGSFYDVLNFQAIEGKGIKGTINNTNYSIGSISFQKEKITEDISNDINNYLKKGMAVVLLSNNENIVGIISLKDKIRDKSKDTITELKKLGYSVNLLTGDNNIIAKNVGEELEIDNVYSELLPLDKVNIIKNLNKNYKTIMIGDGINDALSMKTANIGITFSGIGSDITQDNASIILLNDRIDLLPYVVKLSRSTLKTIKFNIALSIVINIIAVILSAFGILNPITGAIVHNIGSVIVVLNAALLIDRKIK